jgi:hypothetical protein
MSLQNFIPQLWSDTILAAYRKKLVFGNIVNHDYEGQIRQMGDTVKINAIGDITISNYTKDTDINPPQALTDAQTMLVISQAKYFNFEVDDIDAAQAHPAVMAEASSWAAFRAADTIDQFVAGFYTDAIAANTIGSSASPTIPVVATQANIGGGQTVYDYLVVLGQKLDEQFVPDEDRWMVVPPWVESLLIQDIRWTSFNTPQARATIADSLDGAGGNANAMLGQIHDFTVYKSVNAPHIGGTVGIAGSQDVVIAGQRDALTFALGINKTEAYRPPYRFADALKGLYLYGAKTVRPYAMAVAYLQHP